MTHPSIEFTPSPEDAATAALAAAPAPWGGRERLRLVLAGVSIALLIFFVIASYNWRVWGLFIIRWEELAAFAFAGAATGWLWGRRKPNLLAPDDPRLRARTVTIESRGLRIDGVGYETFIDWSAVTGINDRFDVILFTTEWQDVHFVPKRVFPTREDADAFEAAAGRAWARRWDGLTADSREGTS